MSRITQDFRAGGAVQETVGTSTAAFSAQDCRGCIVKAHAANSGKVYIGFDSSMSITTGYELSAGEATPWMPWVGNLEQVYADSDTASQKVSVMYAVG